MPKKKQFKSSSYDKVADVLQKFPEWDDVRPLYLKKLNDLFLADPTFHRGSVYVGAELQMISYARFVVLDKATKEEICSRQDNNITGPDDFTFEVEKFVPQQSIEQLVDKHFGTPECPTYNCKKEKVIEKLVARAKQDFLSYHQTDVDACRKKLFEQAQAIMETDAFKERKSRTYDLGVIAEFKSVLKKYANKVGPDVLREAFREFVTEDIMEA